MIWVVLAHLVHFITFLSCISKSMSIVYHGTFSLVWETSYTSLLYIYNTNISKTIITVLDMHSRYVLQTNQEAKRRMVYNR